MREFYLASPRLAAAFEPNAGHHAVENAAPGIAAVAGRRPPIFGPGAATVGACRSHAAADAAGRRSRFNCPYWKARRPRCGRGRRRRSGPSARRQGGRRRARAPRRQDEGRSTSASTGWRPTSRRCLKLHLGNATLEPAARGHSSGRARHRCQCSVLAMNPGVIGGEGRLTEDPVIRRRPVRPAA